MEILLPSQPPIVERSIQLSRHQQFTHVGQVLQDVIQQLGLSVLPTLLGDSNWALTAPSISWATTLT